MDVVAGVEESRQIPEVLAGMIPIDDLNGAGKILVGKVPDPLGAVSYHGRSLWQEKRWRCSPICKNCWLRRGLSLEETASRKILLAVAA